MEFWQLKQNIETIGNEKHFFDNDTLKFFGERLSDMRVLQKLATITDVCGESHECYIVSAKRRKNWNGTCKPYTCYHYFDSTTFNRVIK